MGADRWHAMLAGWVRCKASFAVVDAGSAVTVDYVNAGGRHLGGYILPGLQMMRRSLKVDAARIGLGRVSNSTPARDNRPANASTTVWPGSLRPLSRGFITMQKPLDSLRST